MACRDSVVRTTVPAWGDTFQARAIRACESDRAALGVHTAEDYATDEFYHDREFSLTIDLIRFFFVTEIFCRDKLLKAFCSNRKFFVAIDNPRTWDFPCCDMGLMS